MESNLFENLGQLQEEELRRPLNIRVIEEEGQHL